MIYLLASVILFASSYAIERLLSRTRRSEQAEDADYRKRLLPFYNAIREDS